MGIIGKSFYTVRVYDVKELLDMKPKNVNF